VNTQRARLAESLLSFSQLTIQATSERQLLPELMSRLAPFGVTHVSAGVTTDRNRVFKIGNRNHFGQLNMAWASTYFGRRLFRDDPILGHSLRAERANYWDRAIDMSRVAKPGQRVLSMAASCGVKDGFIVPAPLFNGDVMIVAFQGERLDRDPDVEALMRGLGMYYGMEGQRLITAANMRAGSLSALTGRQIQTLHLAALGRRQAEIAAEMGISLNTVEYHLKMARGRLGARNTAEAIALLYSTPPNLFRSYGDP
jgi:LuxR family quorum sensing-dependent transcriptional regulator